MSKMGFAPYAHLDVNRHGPPRAGAAHPAGQALAADAVGCMQGLPKAMGDKGVNADTGSFLGPKSSWKWREVLWT